ncbi:MAG: DUF2306 domain-containing protein [Pseudomonadota bacterium]
MSLDPLLTEPFVILMHVAFVLTAIVLTPLQLILPKGTVVHKWIGRVWVLALGLTALVSFGIESTISPIWLGPIHILSALTLASLWFSMNALRQGRIAAHRKTMRQLSFWALLVTGAFTLAPGRVMHAVVFGA